MTPIRPGTHRHIAYTYERRAEVVVVHHFLERDVDERARRCITIQIRDAVDVIRLPEHARLRRRIVRRRTIDDGRYDAPQMALVPLGRDRALQLGESLEPLELERLRHIVRELGGTRPFLRRVAERADALEARLFEEVEQPREVVVGLAG